MRGIGREKDGGLDRTFPAKCSGRKIRFQWGTYAQWFDLFRTDDPLRALESANLLTNGNATHEASQQMRSRRCQDNQGRASRPIFYSKAHVEDLWYIYCIRILVISGR